MPAAITYVDTTVPRWPTWAGAGVDCLREVGRASGYRPVIMLWLRKDRA